jgi:hypothetical protein
MAKDDGGMAFPSGIPGGRTGLTKREWFAGMALQGMLAHSRGNPPHGYRPPGNDHWHVAIAKEAHQLADAMIAAGKENAE